MQDRSVNHNFALLYPNVSFFMMNVMNVIAIQPLNRRPLAGKVQVFTDTTMVNVCTFRCNI